MVFVIIYLLLSIIFASGGLVSAVATNGISLVAISTLSFLIQGWMKHKELDLKFRYCTYIMHTNHINIYLMILKKDIKESMRSGECNRSVLCFQFYLWFEFF